MYTLSVFFLCVNTVVLKHEPLTVEWKEKPLHRAARPQRRDDVD